jgi:hypothetical protein
MGVSEIRTIFHAPERFLIEVRPAISDLVAGPDVAEFRDSLD